MRRSAPAPPLRARHVQLSTACARERALYLFTVLSGLISGWFRYVHSIKSLEQWCVLSRCARTRIAVGRRARVSDPRPGRPTTACNTSYPCALTKDLSRVRIPLVTALSSQCTSYGSYGQWRPLGTSRYSWTRIAHCALRGGVSGGLVRKYISLRSDTKAGPGPGPCIACRRPDGGVGRAAARAGPC